MNYSKNCFNFFLTLVVTSSLFFSCAPAGSTGSTAANSPDTNLSTSPSPQSGISVEVAPLWEASKSVDTRKWTLFTYDTLKNYGANLVSGAQDMTRFCKKYFSLDENRRINVLAYLLSAVTKFESGFSPTSRYKETTLGIDSVTGQAVYSEGLLQLSYQDVLTHPYCDEFDWNTDRMLSPTDPTKTIFDAYKNLKCGIQILNQQVERTGLIAINSGAYWSTLEPKGSAEPQIEALTNKISFCN